MERSLKEMIGELDSWIRHGAGRKAREELEKIEIRHLPRPFAAPLAALARRVDFPELAIAILHPLVRPGPGSLTPASPAEIAEYAAALTYVGASREALVLLREVSPVGTPEVLLYTAFALFAQWDYRLPIPLLQRYVATEGLDPYWKLVGQINLAASLVHERQHRDANQLLDDLLEATSLARLGFHRAKTLELLAENSINQGNWVAAQKYLFEASSLNRDAASWQRLFLRKWRAVLELKKEGPNDETLKSLDAVKAMAQLNVNWETLRDCDQYAAVAKKDTGLFTHLYFGTPFEPFRARLQREFERRVELPPFYRWKLAESFESHEKARLEPAKEIRTLEEGENRGESRLLQVLASDFYNGFQGPTLAFHLNRSELYHPTISSQRVSQAVTHFRQWADDARVPLVVREQDGLYRLGALVPVVVRVPRELITAGVDEFEARKKEVA